VVGFSYINYVLNRTEIKEIKKEKKSAVEVKPVKVLLNFQGKESFTARLQNIDTVGDLLNQLREEKKFTFERIRYTYGTEISNVNRVSTPIDYVWKVYFDGQDITKDIDNIKLVDEGIYELNLVKR